MQTCSMIWPYKYFTRVEMECRGFKKGDCSCGGGLPRLELMERLEALREDVGIPFVIISGYRCPEYNVRVSRSGLDGAHTRGLAADLRIAGRDVFTIVAKAIEHGFTGIGLNQRTGSLWTGRSLHLDCVQPGDAKIPRPAIWNY